MKFLIVASIIFITLPTACNGHSADTLVKSSNQRLTLRLHSAGLFAYSGRIVSGNPVMDINFNYERRRWGYTCFKAQDLMDVHSAINFMLTGFYTNLKIKKKLTVTPYLAFRLGQTMSVADKGSDAVFILTTSYHLYPHLVIDNSSLFTNIVLERQNFDWVNRFRLLYSNKHLDFGLMVYNNNRVFDRNDYVSGGMNVAYTRIQVSDHVWFSAGITGIVMIRTSDVTEFPKRNGIFFTLAVVVH